MSEPCVIKADYASWRPVAGRKVLQLTLEVPIEQTQDVMEKLGVPMPGESKWVAVALLQEPEGQVSGANGSPKTWTDYNPSQQAAILCDDPDFQQYFGATPETVASKLRAHFRIESRRDLDKPEMREKWDEFVAIYKMRRK